jgi:hypothetical protein
MLKRIDYLLKIYEQEHPLKHFPSTLREFQNVAAKKRRPSILGCSHILNTRGARPACSCRTRARKLEKAPQMAAQLSSRTDGQQPHSLTNR